jgi:hypothetical protein
MPLNRAEHDAAKSAWEMSMMDPMPRNFKERVLKHLLMGKTVDEAVDAIIEIERSKGKA